MSWRLGLGVAVVTVLSIAAVVFAITSVTGPSGAERIKEAIRWPPNCGRIIVERPSHAPVMNRWASSRVQTADIVCAAIGPRVAYARFGDRDSVNRAIAADPPSGRYCLLGASVVIDGLVGVDPTVFTDMCQALTGTFVSNVR
jgi:hypothetical protein